MLKFTEILKTGKSYNPKTETVDVRYSLKEVFVNPLSVVMVYDNHDLNEKNAESCLIDGLDSKTRFSEVVISSQGQAAKIINVAAAASDIAMMIREHTR